MGREIRVQPGPFLHEARARTVLFWSQNWKDSPHFWHTHTPRMHRRKLTQTHLEHFICVYGWW